MSPVIDMGLLLLLQGRPAEALDRFKSPVVQPPLTVEVAMALHSLGRDEESAAILRDEGTRSERYVATRLGFAYAWLGDRDHAFASFERALDEHDPLAASGIMSDPILRSLRDDPRWKPLLRRMNLPAD